MITALASALVAWDVPVGWSNSPEDVDMVQAVLLLAGIPLLLFFGIALAVYIPSLVRGEPLTPGAPAVENQWLGGPRATAGELSSAAATSTDRDPDAGGASGRW